MPDSIKLIIFDLDGTLVDAYQAVARSLNYTLKKIGLPAQDHQTIKRRVGWGDRNLVEWFVPVGKVDQALGIYRRHHKKSLRMGTKFLPGVRKLLNHLRRKHYRLAIASNRPTAYTLIILRYLKIENLFDCVLCADKVSRPKPAPDLLSQIMRRCSWKPFEALYVGDMVIDVQAGKRAGVKTIAIVTGSSTKAEIRRQKPFRIVDHIGHVAEVIEELNINSRRGRNL